MKNQRAGYEQGDAVEACSRLALLQRKGQGGSEPADGSHERDEGKKPGHRASGLRPW
jgi:hypothetical protein